MKNAVKVIYNPKSGKKRRSFSPQKPTDTVEHLKYLLKKYQILADYAPVRSFQEIKKLAAQAAKQKYHTVIVAGGDGTVGEVANGLVGTETTLGIIPMGTFMNVAQMLAIPTTDMEKAVEVIKIGRTRKIDVGCVSRLSGKKLSDPYYFIESVGVGLDAEVQKAMLEWEKGDPAGPIKMLQTLFHKYPDPVTLAYNGKKNVACAPLITIANGPLTGANLRIAPRAKLNDHILTVTMYQMTRLELEKHFFGLLMKKKIRSRHVKTFTTDRIRIVTPDERPIHADGRLFGSTPAEVSILPNALNVICGFPDPGFSDLKKKTYLDE